MRGRSAAEAAKPKTVAVRLSGETHETLARAAKKAKIPASRLARVLISFGLDQLAKGNRGLERAVKISRDAADERAVRAGSRDAKAERVVKGSRDTRAERAAKSSRDAKAERAVKGSRD